MVNTSSRHHLRAAQRPAAHGDERGATLFIVLMVLMVLSAIGTFAASNARFETQTAGFERQRTVTHEVTAFGAFAAMGEMGQPGKAAPYSEMVKKAGSDDPSKKEICAANAGLGTSTARYPCFHVYLSDVQNSSGFAGGLISPPDPALGMPGSLGLGTKASSGALSGMNGGFSVEITEIYESPRPIPGFDNSDAAPAKAYFYDFTLTSSGFVFYDQDLNGKIEPGERGGSTYSSGRGHVVIGPIIKK